MGKIESRVSVTACVMSFWLRNSSKISLKKNCKNPKKVKCDRRTDGSTDGPTKRGVELRSTRLEMKIIKKVKCDRQTKRRTNGRSKQGVEPCSTWLKMVAQLVDIAKMNQLVTDSLSASPNVRWWFICAGNKYSWNSTSIFRIKSEKFRRMWSGNIGHWNKTMLKTKCATTFPQYVLHKFHSFDCC